MIYKFKLTGSDGETEIVEGDWPNQRDAAKYAVMSSAMWNVWAVQNQVPTAWDRCGIECELLEPLALRGRGRPRFDPAAPTVRTTIRLTSAQLAKAEELGGGNVGAGVRLALEKA